MHLIHWFVRWTTTYPHWAISTMANIAVAAFIWCRGCRDRICITQVCVAFLSVYVVVIGYSDCSVGFYRWTNWSTDVLCSIMELAIALDVTHRCTKRMGWTYPELAVVVSIFVHQYHKLWWHWSAELFHLPDNGYDETMRFATNLATIISVGVLVYCETGQLAPKEVA